jgi:hypothetical protein
MSYLRDLSRWPGQGLGPRALAVGWLDAEHDFPTGTVRPEFFSRLFELLKSPWQPSVAAGRHACPFCRFTGGPSQLAYAGQEIAVGATDLVVPAEATIFVAPSMIAHYVDAHGYAPPQAFVEAVFHCPEMRSMPYLRLLRAHGVSVNRAANT